MDSNPTGNDSIQVVDQTPVNLKLVSALLSKQGFQLRTAAPSELRDQVEVQPQQIGPCPA